MRASARGFQIKVRAQRYIAKSETGRRLFMRFFKISFIAALLAVVMMPRQAVALEIQDVRKGVVRIISIGNDSVTTGTGFAINDSGNIVTNHHVIANALSGKRTIKILTDDLAEQLKPEIEKKFGGRVHSSVGLVDDKLKAEILVYLLDKLPDATVKWSDEKLDLAILNSSSTLGLLPLMLSPSELVSESQTVYALGYPGKSDKVGVTAFLTLKTLNGIVASKDFASSSSVQVYQTTAPFSSGNSGGPLVTDCGEVIGINSFDIGQRIGNVSVGESIRYSIQVDELINQLDRQGIDYEMARSYCAAQQGMNVFTLAALGIAIMLGFIAVIIASTGRGRRAVKDLTRSFHKSRPSPAPLPSPGRREAPVLRGLQGEFAGKTIELGGTALVIGRDPRACHLVFSSSLEGVSKRHCALKYEPANRAFALEDLGSTNGTFVLSGGKGDQLKPGEVRHLGANERFYLSDPGMLFEVKVENR